MISLGQGGYNPSLQAFGADQLENEEETLPAFTKNDQISDNKSWFFQWWYFGICSESLLGVSLMAYIQDTLGWGLGFSSVLFFSCGSRFYAYKHAKDDGVKAFAKIVHAMKATASKMSNCAVEQV